MLKNEAICAARYPGLRIRYRPGRPVPWGLTVNRDDEFLRNAAEAQRSALGARTDDERATWLRLAEGWLGLVGKYPQTDGQDDSESLH
jgi:hypothetical protein